MNKTKLVDSYFKNKERFVLDYNCDFFTSDKNKKEKCRMIKQYLLQSKIYNNSVKRHEQYAGDVLDCYDDLVFLAISRSA
jgi:hypothetical protein